MRNRIILLLALVLSTVFLTGLTPSNAAITTPACPPVSLTRTGAQSSAVSGASNSGTWRLFTATWTNTDLDVAVNANPSTNACIKGGRVDGAIPKTATRDMWYDGVGMTKSGVYDAFVFQQSTARPNYGMFRNTYAEDYEDAYDTQADGTGSASKVYLDHVEAKNIRDDCFENEGSKESPDLGVRNVYIKNSLFDGCFTGLGWRPPESSSASDGSNPNASFTMEDSLLRVNLQPLGDAAKSSNGAPKYCSSAKVTSGRCYDDPNSSDSHRFLGGYGIWKWSTDAPVAANHVVRNTVFRLDGQSYSSCTPWNWPNGTYENVTLVWAGPSGQYNRLCSDALPAGVTLTEDVSVWNTAVANWRQYGTPFPPEAENQPPTVSAGPDRFGVTVEDAGSTSVALSPTWDDPEVPNCYDDFEQPCNAQMTVVSAPAGAGIWDYLVKDANMGGTGFGATVAGTYTLRLTVTDYQGLSASDEMQVVLTSP